MNERMIRSVKQMLYKIRCFVKHALRLNFFKHCFILALILVAYAYPITLVVLSVLFFYSHLFFYEIYFMLRSLYLSFFVFFLISFVYLFSVCSISSSNVFPYENKCSSSLHSFYYIFSFAFLRGFLQIPILFSPSILRADINMLISDLFLQVFSRSPVFLLSG